MISRHADCIRAVLTEGEILENFFVIEGCDGAGKTSIGERVAKNLDMNGVNVNFIREPGTTEVGMRIRSMLLDREKSLDSNTQFMLFAAARASLVDYIKNNPNKVFICDRYLDSTLVYQCLAVLNMNSSESEIKRAEYFLALMIQYLKMGIWVQPRYTFTIARREKDAWKAAVKEANVFEKKGKEFFSAVYKSYYDIIPSYSTVERRNNMIFNPEGKMEEVADIIDQKISSAIYDIHFFQEEE